MGHECTIAEMFHGQCGAMDTATAAMMLVLTLAVLAVVVAGLIASVRR